MSNSAAELRIFQERYIGAPLVFPRAKQHSAGEFSNLTAANVHEIMAGKAVVHPVVKDVPKKGPKKPPSMITPPEVLGIDKAIKITLVRGTNSSAS